MASNFARWICVSEFKAGASRGVIRILSINGETLPASGEWAMDDLGNIEDADTTRSPVFATGSVAAPFLPQGLAIPAILGLRFS
jgi:hypothetical protein